MEKRTTSPAGVAKIAGFEGCKLSAYRDASTPPVWTVGYGHTGPGVTQGLTITQARAEQLLASDLLTFEASVTGWVAVPLNQYQFDALVSFCYNVGPGAPGVRDGLVWLKARDANGQPQHSTLLRKLNRSDYLGCADEFPKWVRAGGAEVLPGLVKRRAAERTLFLGEITTA
jgi:lysozyme